MRAGDRSTFLLEYEPLSPKQLAVVTYSNCIRIIHVMIHTLLANSIVIETYPEWPHRQCVGLAYPWYDSVAAASLAIFSPRLHRAIRGSQGDATSQLDLPYLTPFYVADCGRRQLGVSIWATS